MVMTGHRLRRLSQVVTRGLTVGLLAVIAATALQLALGVLTAAPAAADPGQSTWARLRGCESSGDYTIVSANGHYGAYQFDVGTWLSVGGTGFPNQASPGEQDYRALYLYRMRGWQPWACGRILNLQPDADAASQRVPTYADAFRVNGNPIGIAPAPAPVTAGGPAWPGRVFQYGDCNPALRDWQLRMNTYGFAFEGTGCYYDKTKAAVLALQRANGIRDSGILGPKTWAAAWHGTAPRH